MNRGIILVAMPWMRSQDPPLPLGHASLLASLKEDPSLDICSVVCAVNGEGFSVSDVARTLLHHAAGMPQKFVDIAVGAYIWNEKFVKELLYLVRKRGFAGRIILGGPQVTYAGTGLEQLYPEVDVFVRGYAEIALRKLVQNDPFTKIKGVHYAGELDLCAQADSSLEALPSPWMRAIPSLEDQYFVRWETQRGCTFRCSFCQHRQADARMPCIFFTEDRIAREIDLFCHAGVKRIAVLDPVFNNDRAHAIRVLHRFLERDYRGELSLQCRAEMVDNTFLDAAQNLNVCLEFGLQSIHWNECDAVDRPNNMDKVSQVLQDVKSRGIRHEVSLIYGLPKQTLESFQASVRLCLEQGVQTIKAFPLLLLRGTPLVQAKDRWALVVRDEDWPVVIESDTFNIHEWHKMERIAEALNSTAGHHPSKMNELIRIADRTNIASNCSRLRALDKGA